MSNEDFIPSIRRAIKENNIEMVEKLIGDSKERLNTIFVFGSWLHEAAKLGFIELAGKLIDMGIDTKLEAKSYKGSALSVAAAKGQNEMIKFLLSKGIKFDLSNTDANPLFRAIVANHVDTVRLLIELGIDISVNYANKCDEPWTVLELAEQYGNDEIINIIKYALNKNDKTVVENNSDRKEFCDFIEREVGEIDTTIEGAPLFNENKMNVHIIEPFVSKDYKILMTDGMSALALADNNYAELMVRIPNSWVDDLIENQNDKSKGAHWIFKWLIYLSYIPFRHNCYIFNFLAIPASINSKPIFEGTEMTSFMYISPKEEKWRKADINGKVINLYDIIPLYEEEYKMTDEKTGEAVMKLFEDNSISTIINWKRIKLV